MQPTATSLDFKQLSKDIYEHGIANLPDILPVQWADELDEDVGLQFIDALKIEGERASRFGAGAVFISSSTRNACVDFSRW